MLSTNMFYVAVLLVVFAVKQSVADRCSDGSSCPTGTTCCQMISGKYGCCPLPHAVCCPDKLHCCPQGYKCDSANTCAKGFSIIQATMMMPSTTTDSSVTIPCPGGGSCPDQTTCCPSASGGSGCCPHPQAVCCSDKRHCCPHGYKCDAAGHHCTKGYTVIESALTMRIETEEEAKEMSNSVVNDMGPCPGGGFCPEGSTCCPMASGVMGCCPYPNAVCCSDKQHCCPHGTRCDNTGTHCLRGNTVVDAALTMPTETKEEAKIWSDMMVPEQETGPCPGGGFCPEGSTCCPMASGAAGCCPYPNAVCCKDKQHCCPHATHCDDTSTHCLKGNAAFDAALTMPSDIKDEAEEVSNSVVNVMGPCPGGGFCPEGNTCCPLPSGGEGCCPYPDAVCCKDKQHCCPRGTHCDATSTHCLKGNSVFEASLKSPSRNLKESGDVPCPDGSSCPVTNKCCLEPKSGMYTCCLMMDTCCPSGRCCSYGLKCHGAGCVRDPIPWN